MTDLFSQVIPADFEARAVVPARELGAYEAIWLHEGTSFKTIGGICFERSPARFRPTSAGGGEAEKYSRIALGAIRAAD